jgi:predicted transcriptional regulator YdeE
MDAKVIRRPPMNFLGVERRFISDTEDPGYSNLWFTQFMPKESEFSKYKIDDCFYALILNNSLDGSWTYMPSVRIHEILKIPEGMILRHLPAAQFLEFETTVADIGCKWSEIAVWLKDNPLYRQKEDLHSYEFYPPNTTTPESSVLIYVPIEEGPWVSLDNDSN